MSAKCIYCQENGLGKHRNNVSFIFTRSRLQFIMENDWFEGKTVTNDYPML